MICRRWSSVLAVTALSATGALAACDDSAFAPQSPQLNVGVADNGNGVYVEVGEHSAPFGLIVRDAQNQLLLYYRWDNGFCGGVVATDFVLSTYKDVIRVDESWRTLDKTEGFWYYVYPWNGTPANPGCNFLRTTTPLATGRGDRLLLDNDFYPFAPYGPGPGANAYVLKLRGALATPAGAVVQFTGQIHIVADADGSTIRNWRRTLRLSPDPR